jgi:undecaprenyl diphosphate synthase
VTVENYLRADSRVLAERGARLSVVGRRDRLPDSLFEAVCAAEAATANGREFHLRLAVDYSARDAVLRASSSLGAGISVSLEAFARLLADMNHDACGPPPDCDLLIRAGGEQRLSDCLLWESPYAELIFTERMWPDFNGVDLEAALREFYSRNRRFGQVSLAAAG